MKPTKLTFEKYRKWKYVNLRLEVTEVAVDMCDFPDIASQHVEYYEYSFEMVL